LPLLVYSGAYPSSSGLIRELIRVAPLLACSVRAVLAEGVTSLSLVILVVPGRPWLGDLRRRCRHGLWRCRRWGLGRSSCLGRRSSCLGRSRGSFLRRPRCWLFQCSRRSLFWSGSLRHYLGLRLLRSFLLVCVGALVASASIVFSSGAAGISAGVWGILLSPRVHVGIRGRSVVFRRRAIPRWSSSLVGRGQRCPARRRNQTYGRHIRACRRRRLLSVWGGTRTGSMFQNQWSPEEEKQVRDR
jgi:hypothetical protein